MTNKIGCVQHDCDECKDLRAKLADAEARLASTNKQILKIGDWSIDRTTGTDILMLDGCSVIEGKYAHLIMRLIRKEIDGVVEHLEERASLTPQPAPDVQAAVAHIPNAEYCPHCKPCRNGKLIDDTCRLNERYNDVLRGLCSYLSAGGWTTTIFAAIDPQSADERIRWGIDNIVEVESARRSKAAVAAALEKAEKIAADCYMNGEPYNADTKISLIPRDNSALDEYKADIKRLLEALQTIADGGARNTHKADKCLYGWYGFGWCGSCIEDFARIHIAELKAKYNL